MLNKRVYILAATCCVLSMSPLAPTLADEPSDAEGQRCLNSRSIAKTDVIDDYNILFYSRGRAIYRNTLPRRCTGLARDKRFMYQRTASRLCMSDIINVLHDSGSSITPGRSCRLGRFHPISKEEAQALQGKHDIEPEPIPPPEPEEPETSGTNSSDKE